MTVIRIEDCRNLKLCSAGLRRFANKHGLDFQDFVRDGIDSGLLPQNDAMVEEIVAQARLREAMNEQR